MNQVGNVGAFCAPVISPILRFLDSIQTLAEHLKLFQIFVRFS